MNSLSLNLIKKADKYYRQWFNKTPIEYSKVLSDHLQTPVIFKLENMHVTGSYKLRCAHFAFSKLTDKEKRAGIAIASNGYFGLAFAYVCYMHGVECHIYTPTTFEKSFKEKILGYDAFLHTTTKKSFSSLETHVKKITEKKSLTFIETSSQIDYMATGGSLTKEIFEDVPQAATFVMPLSYFGLLDGAQFYLSKLDTGFHLIAAHLKTESRLSKKQENKPYDTLISVSEKEVKSAQKWLLNHHQILVDKGGALPLAAMLKKSSTKYDGPIVLVLSGRYIEKSELKSLL